MDGAQPCLYCSACKDAGVKNVFTTGQRLFSIAKVQYHEKKGGPCVLNKEKPLVDLLQKGNVLVENRRRAYGNIAYAISHKSTASELDMEDNLTAAYYAMLELDERAPNICAEKAHEHGASEMTHAFSHTLEEKQLERIRASPVISVGCDETTDVSTQSALIVYIYYIFEGEPTVEYFTLRRLSGGKAVDICSMLVEILEGACLMDKLVCLGSDGCSTMLGKDGGVSTLLRAKVQQLLTFHCMAHKLHLAIGSAFATDCCHQCDRLAGSCYRLVHNSPKRGGELGTIFKGITGKEMNAILRLIVTRWLSRHAAYSSIITSGMLESLMQFTSSLAQGGEDARDWTYAEPVLTEQGKDGAMKYDELAVKLRDFKLLGMVHFIADITEHLNVLSKVLQSSVQDGHIVLATCKALVTSIKECYPQGSAPIKWGARASAFMAKTVGEGGVLNNKMEFGKQVVDVTAEELSDLVQEVRDVSELLVTELEDRMPDNPILEALLVFDPRRAPGAAQATDWAEYGDAEIETICTHFKLSGPVKVDDTKLKSQWLLFKYDKLKTMPGSSLRAVYKQLYNELQGGTHQLYDEIFKVMGVSCILPLSNAVSERGFSTLNNIKTCEKSRMSFTKADARMRCSLLGPPMTDRSAVRTLVAKAVTIVFKGAVPARAAGGRAAAASRVRKRNAADHVDAVTAISKHGCVTADGSDPLPVRPPFPAEYNALAEMPLASSLGPQLRLLSKIFYLWDDGKGKGVKWHLFNINQHKIKMAVGADGNERQLRNLHRVVKGRKGYGPGKGGWNYLSPERYGPIDGCWVVAEKLAKAAASAQRHAKKVSGACTEVNKKQLEHLTTNAFHKLNGNAGLRALDIKNEIEKKLKHQLTLPQAAMVRKCISRLVDAAREVSSDDDDDSSSSSSSDEDDSASSSSSSSSSDDDDNDADGDATMRSS